MFSHDSERNYGSAACMSIVITNRQLAGQTLGLPTYNSIKKPSDLIDSRLKNFFDDLKTDSCQNLAEHKKRVLNS